MLDPRYGNMRKTRLCRKDSHSGKHRAEGADVSQRILSILTNQNRERAYLVYPSYGLKIGSPSDNASDYSQVDLDRLLTPESSYLLSI